MQILATRGWHPSDAFNGKSVPGILNSPGGHQNYNDFVSNKLYDLVAPTTGNQNLEEEMFDLVSKLDEEIDKAIAANKNLNWWFSNANPNRPIW